MTDGRVPQYSHFGNVTLASSAQFCHLYKYGYLELSIYMHILYIMTHDGALIAHWYSACIICIRLIIINSTVPHAVVYVWKKCIMNTTSLNISSYVITTQNPTQQFSLSSRLRSAVSLLINKILQSCWGATTTQQLVTSAICFALMNYFKPLQYITLYKYILNAVFWHQYTAELL